MADPVCRLVAGQTACGFDGKMPQRERSGDYISVRWRHVNYGRSSMTVRGAIQRSRIPSARSRHSSFFINPARAANGLWVALEAFGELSELSEKYCWSV
ncbi:hypothetical protein SAMN05216593_103471 [Pseudomonas asturiensis]|uniref:Uncharacterized protein n=1 Tax=Pseudomonas asturiensis TaxID=1190415 RepID=A0A1M7LZD2_9PSED|nr:hypothetical protein SAMN05216593_103471 [Pseudomonas asturiensis]